MALIKQSFTVLFGLLFLNISEAQEKEMSNTFSIGIQTRVTPIYFIKETGDGIVPNSYILSQADQHYSGPGVIFGWQKQVNPHLEFSINPTIRYDYLYDVKGFDSQAFQDLHQRKKRSFVLDTYADVKYLWSSEKTRKSIGIGLAMCGIGTGYIREQLVLLDNETYAVSTREDYQFPAVYLTSGLKFKDRFFTELKLGFCWQNPDLVSQNKFLFPEIRVSYDLFKF